VPRPSSPVHAKASTKCSYLTLENPHHQRQPCIMAALFIGADDNLSQIYICKQCNSHEVRRPHTNAPRHRLKTHSQCQREGKSLVHRRPDRNPVGEFHVFIPGVWLRLSHRTPSVAAKLRLTARFAALAALAARRGSAWLIHSATRWWSLSGSNR
jgi:hypothetical protein